MKSIYHISFLILSCSFSFSQSNPCVKKLDTLQVIEIAKKQNAYWDQNDVFQPEVIFDQKYCEWTVQSTKTKHTLEGDCKNTNGCTEITTLTLILDDNTKKVKSKTKEIKLLPNYE